MKPKIDTNDFSIFQSFYNQYSQKENILYMYCTTNLLHYVTKASGLVPKDINLVLIMAGVTDDEEEYVKNIIKRPYVRLKNGIKDGYIWEMLFVVNKYNFGWLDIDAFIFNKEIFYEMQDIKDNVSVNSVWNRKYDKHGIDDYLANTFYQFHNIKCIHHIMDKYENVSPMMSLYGDEKQDSNDYFYVPQNLQKCIQKKYPETIQKTWDFYDTTFFYQIFAYIENYQIGKVRNLSRIGEYYSNEAIHLGQAFDMHRLTIGETGARLFFRFNIRYSYMILLEYIDQLPKQYREYQLVYEQNMIRNGIRTELSDVEKHVKSYLARHGLSEEIYYR